MTTINAPQVRLLDYGNLAAVKYGEYFMSVSRLLRSPNNETFFLAEEKVVAAAHNLEKISTAMDALDLSEFFPLSGIWVTPTKPDYSLNGFPPRASSEERENVFVYSVSRSKKEFLESSQEIAKNASKTFDRFWKLYDVTIERGEVLFPVFPKEKFSLFSYNKQTGKIADMLKIARFITINDNGSDYVHAWQAETLALGLNLAPSHEHLINSLHVMVKLIVAALSENEVEATSENIAAYVDYTCILQNINNHDFADFTAIIRKHMGQVEKTDGFFYTSLIKRGWTPEFLLAIYISEIELESEDHIEALKEIWGASPSEWFLKFLLAK